MAGMDANSFCKESPNNLDVKFGVFAILEDTSLILKSTRQIFLLSSDDKYFGKASALLVKMLHVFPDHVKYLPLDLYFDNLFTGLNLLSYLSQIGYTATGTIRENRIPEECKLIITAEARENQGDIMIISFVKKSI